MKTVTPQELLDASVHLGHKKAKVHPRSRKFMYKVESGTSIIDLFKTAEELTKAQNFVRELGKADKTLLVIGTKKTAREIIETLCEKNSIPYVTSKWTAGYLTNFGEINKNVARLKDWNEAKEAGEWKKFVKHEQVQMEKKLNRIAGLYDGVASMTKVPDAVFVIDIRKEKNAIQEATQLGITTVALVDTNCDPNTVDFPIPGNDDASQSIDLIVQTIIEAYVEGKESLGKESKTPKDPKSPKAVKTPKAPKKVATKAKK